MDLAILVLTLLGLAAGVLLHLLGLGAEADALWAATIAVMLVPLSWSVVRTLLRRDVGVDAIALVAIAGALALGEYLAGAVVALMLAGGNALESAARRRARRELRLLVERAPRIAHRRRGDSVEEVPIEALEVGDVVVVRPGEVVPVDGGLVSERAVVDESTLTGEPLPVDRARGEEVRSGTANAGEPFELCASRLASESAYAGIVRLVRAAEEQQAPMVRLADRYAALFLPVTLLVAGLAWALSGDPVRALSVLVVATPCPLILAAPIALLSGVSRAARRGIVVKGGGVIEQLGRAKTVLFDKTGTITLGDPALERVVPLDGLASDEILRLAASVDQLSVHALAEALVHDAQRRGLELAYPTQTREAAGLGVEGIVDGRRVAVGSAAWLRSLGYDGRLPEPDNAAGSRILVGVDGHLVGQALVSDPIRDDADRLVPDLRAAGIRHVALVTGDAAAPAERVGRRLEVDRVYADQSPEQKLEIVRALQAREELRPVVMVGDGVNDAPALALAEVGIAMGSAGATVSSETADAVISVDRVDRVADAVRIGRRSLRIAEQSVLAGIGLSLVAMAFAAAGFIPPVAGALLQEGIDVAVILNALRALTDG